MKENTKKILAVIIALALAFFGGTYYSNQVAQEESSPTMTTDQLRNQIINARELTTTKYIYTNAASFEDQHKFRDWNVPLTRKNFIVTYDGVINAGIDVEQVEVTVSDKTIKVKLPEAKVLSHEIDDDSLEVLNEEQGIFNKIQVEDFQEFSIEQKKAVEESAIANGLLDNAQKQAAEAVKAALEVNPEVANGEYTVVIE